MQKLYYLASPYTHPSYEVMVRRFEDVCTVAAALIKTKGFNLFVPIAMSHSLQLYGDLSEKWEYWKQFDVPFLKKCDAILVVTLDGWEESVGVQEEIKIMKKLGKSVQYVHPKTLNITRQP